MSTSTNSDLHVYIINSGFQLVSSVLLANERKNNLFICFEKSLYDSVKAQNTHWPAYEIKFKKLKGLLGRRRGARIYTNKLFDILKNHKYKKYHFYVPVIAGSQYNYIIHHSKEIYGKNNVTFNIIPDGTANMKIEPFSSDRKKKRVEKKDKCLIDRMFGLKYTPYSIDQHGIVSDAVDKIYIIPGMPHEYPENKIKPLPVISPSLHRENHNRTHNKSALILGQRMVELGLLSEKDEEKVKAKIQAFIKNNNITEIYYIPHTVSKIKNMRYELLIDEAKVINTHKPVELYMMDHHFDYIIAISSTALITSKLFFGEHCQSVSIGSELHKESVKGYVETINNTYKNLNILIIPA